MGVESGRCRAKVRKKPDSVHDALWMDVSGRSCGRCCTCREFCSKEVTAIHNDEPPAMKVLAILLLLVSTTAGAATPHWVQIGSGVKVYNHDPSIHDSTSTLVYLDESNPLTEDGFGGFQIRWVFPSEQTVTREDKTTVSYLEMYTAIEYNCQTHQGRGKRSYLISVTDGNRIPIVEEDWRPVVGSKSGAGYVLHAVKARVCK